MCKTSKHSVQQRRRLMVCRLAACSQTIYTFIQSLTRHFCVKVRIKKVTSRFFSYEPDILYYWKHHIRAKELIPFDRNKWKFGLIIALEHPKAKEIHGLLRPYIFIVKIFETAKAWRQFRLSVYHYIHIRWICSSLYLQKFNQHLSVT